MRDAYPLPLPDEVQDRLAGSTVFTTLDLQSGYWQLPLAPEDQAKTAFCPGPGMGLYQFRCMPFGLTGAPGSFQRLMDSLLRDLPFATTYIDDVLIFSQTAEHHVKHLQQVFQRLQDTGLTLRGHKCHIGMSRVYYLGHIFDHNGMHPDPGKISCVHDWPIPTNATTLKQFLGLASYYRRYIEKFADIAAPLHNLTKKDVLFSRSPECNKAFAELKNKLTQAPILAFPQFTADAAPFLLQTDASAIGLGAVLEQGGRVIAYASRALNQSEKQYSTIQKECLAAVYAMKQFCHYLLGRPFQLMTDHAPLQWLTAQKMEGLLCRWALAMGEYDFDIVYRKGTLNGNADALSRQPPSTPSPVAMTSTRKQITDVQQAQQNDPVFYQIYQALMHSNEKPTGMNIKQPLFKRYMQLWHQLSLIDDVICCTYYPSPTSDSITVPLIPPSIKQEALHQAHNIPSAGHQGYQKTLSCLKDKAYWPGMASDVRHYCQSCEICQKSKLPSPVRVPLVNIPIGNPWEMLAVDILEVPVSRNNHHYLLVVMDYFTKWAEAIPLCDQKATTIADAVKLRSSFGIPDILHSDQGRNFESALFSQVLQAFGIHKTRTTAYHPQSDGMVECFNRSLLQLLRCYVDTEDDWERFLPLVLYAYRTAQHSSTRVTPFQLMFGRSPQSSPFCQSKAFDPNTYSAQLQAKLASLQDLVHTNISASAQQQKFQHDKQSRACSFVAGAPVWLSIPTRGKLQPKWQGNWEVLEIKSPTNVKITNGQTTKVVHVNRLRHRKQPQLKSIPVTTTPSSNNWFPPQVDHHIISTPPSQHRYPQRNRCPPNRLQL